MGRDPAIELRRADMADARALSAVARAAYARYVERMGREPRPMREDYRGSVARTSVTVAERGGEILGFVALTIGDEGFLIDNIAVHPDVWGQGVGRVLLEYAEAEAVRAGFDSIHLYTHETMTENQELYARIGYREYERRPDDDSIVVFMRKPLG